GSYKKVSIIYNKFISTLKSEVSEEVLLPFSAVEVFGDNTDQAATHLQQEYKIEPSAEEILEQLILSFIENKIRGALISSEAVEHSARMMAMKSATDNASDIIYNLTLLSNKLRQEKITNELLDMITAKESVDVS
ncbi:F0F1 ATP synthase subunit gamma, partial [Candidatus Woesebacteria bacterium]|nr:F0F1 ATP synthase subunit gamma [Candidatus Woesebacteria bacterium]